MIQEHDEQPIINIKKKEVSHINIYIYTIINELC